MEARPAELVANRRGGGATLRVHRAREIPLGQPQLAVAQLVSDGDPARDQFPGEVEVLAKICGLKHQFSHSALVWPTRDQLENATRNGKRRVVVRDARAERIVLRET